MTSKPNLPIIKFDGPNHVRAYATPYLRTDSEGREVIWAPPRFFLISPEIDRAALIEALSKLSRIHTIVEYSAFVSCMILIGLDFEFLGVNNLGWVPDVEFLGVTGFNWVKLASILSVIEGKSRWYKSRLRETLHPYADHLTEVSVKSSWRKELFGAAKLIAIILLVLAVVTAFAI